MAEVSRESVADVGHRADLAGSAQESSLSHAWNGSVPSGARYGGVVRPNRQPGFEQHRHARCGISERARDEDRITGLRPGAQGHLAAFRLAEHEDIDEDSGSRARDVAADDIDAEALGLLAKAEVEPVDELGHESSGQSERDESEARLAPGGSDIAQVDRQSLAAQVAGRDSLAQEVDAFDLDVAGGEPDLLPLRGQDGHVVADADDDIAAGIGEAVAYPLDEAELPELIYRHVLDLSSRRLSFAGPLPRPRHYPRIRSPKPRRCPPPPRPGWPPRCRH